MEKLKRLLQEGKAVKNNERDGSPVKKLQCDYYSANQLFYHSRINYTGARQALNFREV